MNVLDALSRNASVVIVRLRSLGDTVLTVPAIDLLKAARPDLRIAVVLDRPFAPLLEGLDSIEEVLACDRDRKLAVIQAVRERRPELCLNLHGGSTSMWIAALSGARFRAGFSHFRGAWLYNVRVPRAQQVLGRSSDAAVHTAEHLASAVFHLGAARGPIPRARLAAEPAHNRQPYAVLHVAAAYHTKRWPTERFRRLAANLEQQHGVQAVVIAGPGEDALLEEFEGIGTCRTAPGLDLTSLKNLLAGARLFVGNDSGPAHIAAAFAVPTVVLFGSSDSAVWGPWQTRSEVVETMWDCKPCPGDRCYAYAEPRCILSIDEGAVEAAAARLLA